MNRTGLEPAGPLLRPKTADKNTQIAVPLWKILITGFPELFRDGWVVLDDEFRQFPATVGDRGQLLQQRCEHHARSAPGGSNIAPHRNLTAPCQHQRCKIRHIHCK